MIGWGKRIGEDTKAFQKDDRRKKFGGKKSRIERRQGGLLSLMKKTLREALTLLDEKISLHARCGKDGILTELCRKVPGV